MISASTFLIERLNVFSTRVTHTESPFRHRLHHNLASNIFTLKIYYCWKHGYV